MSLTLIFRSSTIYEVGPLLLFQVNGEALLTPEGQMIAKHDRNVWQISGASYPRLECKGSVLISFQRGSKGEASRKFGPHDNLMMFDGVAYVGTHVFASLNQEAGNWYSHEDGRYWRVMTVESTRKPRTS
jgi:hypothetical protein